MSVARSANKLFVNAISESTGLALSRLATYLGDTTPYLDQGRATCGENISSICYAVPNGGY